MPRLALGNAAACLVMFPFPCNRNERANEKTESAMAAKRP
jgi:hypothetical protein